MNNTKHDQVYCVIYNLIVGLPALFMVLLAISFASDLHDVIYAFFLLAISLVMAWIVVLRHQSMGNLPDSDIILPRNYNAVRRQRLHENGGSFTKTEWRKLCDTYGNRCLKCGRKSKLTVDHVIPLSSGGRNSIDNIQPLCWDCNNKKGTLTIDYRIRRRKVINGQND